MAEIISDLKKKTGLKLHIELDIVDALFQDLSNLLKIVELADSIKASSQFIDQNIEKL